MLLKAYSALHTATQPPTGRKLLLLPLLTHEVRDWAPEHWHAHTHAHTTPRHATTSGAPSADYQYLYADYQYLYADYQCPYADYQYPYADYQYPYADYQYPYADYQYPYADYQYA